MDEVSERLARILDRTGDYRILRRLKPPPIAPMTAAELTTAGLVSGVVLDTETTGLGPEDEIIELGMVRFVYDPETYRVAGVTETFSALRQPGRPIPPDVSRLTGISEADVAGHAIGAEAVSKFVAGANVVVAHNAAFDRPVVERAWPLFAGLPWACSLDQVDWRSEGFEGRKLGQLLGERRLFHDGHRALDDCLALLHLLRLPVALGVTPFELMMREAATTATRVWAVRSNFEARAKLKGRGYRWANGETQGPRAWWRDVPEGSAEAEVAWLREHAYAATDAGPVLRRLTAVDMFSSRAGVL